MTGWRWVLAVSVLLVGAAAWGQGSVARLADEYVDLRVGYDPTLAGLVGMRVGVMRLPDRRAGALRALQRKEDGLLARLMLVTDAGDPEYAVLREELEARKGLRVCRAELWDLSHMEGWQVELPGLAAEKAVGTAEEKRQALELWGSLAGYLRVDEANLREGLREGYVVPRGVVERVLKQVDGLAGVSVEGSVFYSPAGRAHDAVFAAALRREVVDGIVPALKAYADFLRREYMPRARVSLGVSALPGGAACYRAYLRRYTTTEETPEAVAAHGERLVRESSAEIRATGMRLYGVGDVGTVVARSREDKANRFASVEELVDFSKGMVAKSEAMSAGLFLRLPEQGVVVKPLPDYQKGSGMSSHYEANGGAGVATFWIATDDWASETRGAAEITAVHETVPGHHLQMALARGLQRKTRLAKLVFNAAYVEGWANYAERLSEEQGIDGDDFERIQRRAIAGRSLVLDTGIHAFGWTRERAEAYAMETGMSREQADDAIDRVAVEPGQLTSYEVGGLEILSLREAAKARLGARFDLREFHQRVLEGGVVPLTALRAKINANAP